MTDKLDENSKELVYDKICNAVLKLEVSKGHLSWTVSEVSREADVTRSLIYYYFGKEKKVILDEAFRYVVESLYGQGSSKTNLGIQERMQRILAKTKEMPYMFVLFYLERTKDSEAGEIIRKAEASLFEKFKNDYPHLDEVQVKSIYMLELGAIAFGLPSSSAFDFFDPEKFKNF